MKAIVETVASPRGDITIYRLVNRRGASVTLSSLGAGILGIEVPDSEGRLADVVLGYKDPADYFHDGPCAGKVPGRYANRIARGRLEIDGKIHRLHCNNGPNALHGGPEGFQNKIWECALHATDVVLFTLHSPDGDERYPGNLTVSAGYQWTDDNVLAIQFAARTDAPTVVNLTNHAYFNLAGENSGSVLGHELRLNCLRYLPTDDTLIPTGEMAPVAGTPMDFTELKPLGRDIRQDFPALNYGKGYDSCWIIDPSPGSGVASLAATLVDRASGRRLDVFTDQPGVQIYTGNWLAGSPLSKSGRSYDDYDGVAIECQGLPDAPNRPEFPSQLLRPGQEYCRNIFFNFSTI